MPFENFRFETTDVLCLENERAIPVFETTKGTVLIVVRTCCTISQ